MGFHQIFSKKHEKSIARKLNKKNIKKREAMKQTNLLKKEYIEMIDGLNLDVFSTFTLKTAIIDDSGSIRYLDDENICKAATFISERFYRRLSKEERGLPFLVFAEGRFQKRPHLHILSSKPSRYSFFDYAREFYQVSRKSYWVNKEADIKPISENTKRNLISYCFKEGPDALLIEASLF